MRRTYASLRSALRDDPFYIAEHLGHTNPAFTFRVYHKAAKRREKLSGAYLEAFDKALQWAQLGGEKAEKGRIAESAPGRGRQPRRRATSESRIGKL
jgi:hypothetical protein